MNLTLSALNVLQVCQRLTEYGVHFHRVLPEKRSQTGIMLGVYCKGVLIFEVLNGNRTPVLRFPWRETKKISFTVCACVFIIRSKSASYLLQVGPHVHVKCLTCHHEEKEDLPSEHVGRDQAPVSDRQQQDLSVSTPALLRSAQVPPADEGPPKQPGAPRPR